MIISIIIFIILFSCSWILYTNKSSNILYIKSKKDQQYYLVRNLENKENAADMLCEIRQRLIKMCKYCEDKDDNKKAVKLLIDRFNPDNIIESPPHETNTSYSVNKGEEIAICLRSKDRDNYQKFHNINTII